MGVTETAASVGRLIQTRAELKLKILNLRNYLPHTIHENVWNLVDRRKCLFLKNAAYKIKSHFGSSCLCESQFQLWTLGNQIHQLTDAHFDDCLQAGMLLYSALKSWLMKCSAEDYINELSIWLPILDGIMGWLVKELNLLHVKPAYLYYLLLSHNIECVLLCIVWWPYIYLPRESKMGNVYGVVTAALAWILEYVFGHRNFGDSCSKGIHFRGVDYSWISRMCLLKGIIDCYKRKLLYTCAASSSGRQRRISNSNLWSSVWTCIYLSLQ